MRITTLNIYNYKNLSIELNNSSSIIALIGNNGSGKSNILEAISTIFFHVYNKKEKDIPFNFKLEYTIRGNQNVLIEKKNSTINFMVEEKHYADIQQYLPKQIVALYSGEENRLWLKSYQPLYMAYISNINKSETSGLGDYSIVPKMLYINKFYWHISLLCLLLSDALDTKKFCEETLGINKINSIKFDFNTTNYANYSDSAVKSFINLIDTKNDYTITELRKIISESPYSLDIVFKYLYLAFTPDKKKMLENITIKYNDENLDIEDFSEGEKKMLLIKAALEFAGLEDSLFLLDEPDAHIHLSNKIQIKNVFKEYLDTRQVILTTHSPTLTDTLEDDSLYMLNTGKLVPSKKQEILENVSGEFWNKFQQNSFIASKKPIILLVEGKHDKEHITNAFEELKDEFKTLDFEIFKLNTETNIQPFLRGLYESEFDNTKIYIGLFDREAKILNDFKNPKNYSKIDGKDYFKIIESDKPNTNYFVTALPELEDKKCDCSIEMMYDYSKWEEAYQKAVQNTIGKTSNKSIKTFSEDVLNDAKNLMSENSKTFNKDDFKNFKRLFELISEIQTYRNGLIKTPQKGETKKVIEIVEPAPKADFIEIYTKRRGTVLTAHFYADTTKTILQSGSIIANDVVPSFTPKEKADRNKLKKKHCEFKNDKWTINTPIEFLSPSGAIKFGVGSNINGWIYWLIKGTDKILETIR
jgi:predicted ATPase/archaellin